MRMRMQLLVIVLNLCRHAVSEHSKFYQVFISQLTFSILKLLFERSSGMVNCSRQTMASVGCWQFQFGRHRRCALPVFRQRYAPARPRKVSTTCSALRWWHTLGTSWNSSERCVTKKNPSMHPQAQLIELLIRGCARAVIMRGSVYKRILLMRCCFVWKSNIDSLRRAKTNESTTVALRLTEWANVRVGLEFADIDCNKTASETSFHQNIVQWAIK